MVFFFLKYETRIVECSSVEHYRWDDAGYSLIFSLLQPSTAVISFRHTTDVFFLITPCFHAIDISPPPAVPLLYRAKGDFYLINVHYWNHVNFFYQITIILKKCYSYKELSHFDFMVDIRKPNRLIHWCSWVLIFVVIVKSTFSRKCIIRGQICACGDVTYRVNNEIQKKNRRWLKIISMKLLIWYWYC